MENLGKLTYFIVVIVAIFLTSLFGAYVIIQVSELYKLTFITQFTFVQFYGILCIINLIKYNANPKKESEKEDLNFEQSMNKLWVKIKSRIGDLLIFWGMSWLMFQILS